MANAKMQQSWIRAGAEARLGQILEEIEAIYSAFPELRKRGGQTTPESSATSRPYTRKGTQAISEAKRSISLAPNLAEAAPKSKA